MGGMAGHGDSTPGGPPSSGSNGTAAAAAPSPTAPQGAVKARRSHRKSRNGCAECRRRHMRCDKNHPICFNCGTGERTCVYPTLALANASAEATSGGATTTSSSSILQHTPAPTPTPTPSILHEQQDAESNSAEEPNAFSATDLVVFYHAQTTMANVGLGRKGQFQQVVALAMRHRHRAPYLIDQVLALAAVHLSMNLPDTSSSSLSPAAVLLSPSTSLFADMTPESLRHHATRRQIRAVASFKQLTGDSIEDDDDPDRACTRLLFSGILSLQNLAETLCVLRAPDMRFCGFVDSIVHCFNLHRGVRAATGKPLHEFLRYSKELGPMMDILNIDVEIDWRNNHRGNECAPLYRVLDASDLGKASLAAYKAAVQSLQWSFDMCHGLSAQDGPHATVAFAVTAPADYVEALRKYCPEALIILAYYGVLLHRCRQYWVFGDAGARMIRAIADHVGNYWKDALSWPLSIIESDCN